MVASAKFVGDDLPGGTDELATRGQCRAFANAGGIAFTPRIAGVFKPLATGFARPAQPAQGRDPLGHGCRPAGHLGLAARLAMQFFRHGADSDMHAID